MWVLASIFLIIFSIYLSIKLRFKNYKINLKELIKKDKSALFLSLGTKIGVGSIVGTLSSIIIGGFSSVFWIIIFTFLSSSLIYFEAKFGKEYSEKYIGGPYFILKNALNSKYLSYISLIILIILYPFLFQMIQINTITFVIKNTININFYLLVFLISILLFVSINMSLEDIKKILNKVVPFKCFIFIFKEKKKVGRPPLNPRKVFNGILWILKSDPRWRDLPANYGNWNSIYHIFRKWCNQGLSECVLRQEKSGECREIPKFTSMRECN